ncbi:MAG TPA: efflux RND transporter permease subunit [Tepidisphaeraceae bacterium]
MSVASWAHRHARSILFMLVALVVGGALATLVLPVSLFPHVEFARIRVNLEAGERPAERMVVEITRPVEEALRAIPGVRTVHSTTSRGSAEVWLAFDWGENMDNATLQAQAQINRILPSLPAGTEFSVRRMDPTVFPVIAYSLTSKTRPLTELRDLAEFQLRPVLSTVTGVARIGVDGGAVQEYQVIVDPARLQAHGLALSDISGALSAANVLTATGRLEDRFKLYLIVTDTRFRNLEQIAATVLRSGAGGVVRLSDIATVLDATAPQFTRSTADGQDAVLINVYQQPGGNTVEIARGIRDVLGSQKKSLPSDVTISNWYDQSDLITASAHSVRDAVLIGVGLAAVVLLLFLKNFRITLIAALTVPVVLAVTALLLYVLHQSFNIMTLGGMAAAVGLIIDDAIVMSEHIVRRLHGGGDAPNRVLNAADEFTKPLMGSSLSTIIIHIPPAFLIGVTGAFFAALSLSMAASLVISFLVAWLAIPVLAARFLKPRESHRPMEGSAAPISHRAYSSMMGGILSAPWAMLFLVVPILVAGYVAYQRIPSGFMPSVDEGGFVLDYVGPAGTSLSETDRLLRQVEKILQETPEVQTYSRRTGFSLGGDISEANTGDFFVRLKGFPRRSIDEVMDEVRGKIEHTIPGLEVELAKLMEDLIGDLTGRPEPIVINLFADDERELEELALRVAEEVGKVPNVVEVKSGVVPAGDALNIEVDRVKASLEGVDPESLTRSLTELLSGSVVTQVESGPKLVDVRVWIATEFRKTTQDVAELLLRAPDGHLFPLKRVATLTTISGQPEITRENLKQVVSVTGRISGRDLRSTVRDVQQVLDRPGLLPNTVRYTLGGIYEQQQLAFRGLLKVIAAAAALVFLLLLFLYESFRVVIAIMLTTVLAIMVVFCGLWLTGTELNISSMMGLVMIVGNVTEVAIFYYSEFVDSLHHRGDVKDRLIAAGIYRMRAIVMTTVAAILALLPLALGIGNGSEMLQPLAIAIIVGLIAQLPLVLIVLPALLATLKPGTAQPAGGLS